MNKSLMETFLSLSTFEDLFVAYLFALVYFDRSDESWDVGYDL